MNETTQSQEPILDEPDDNPPFFDDNDEGPPEPRPPGRPGRPRGRPKRTINEKRASYLAQLELDEWGDQFDMAPPGAKFRLARLLPTYFEGRLTAGFLEERREKFTQQDIASRYGGGTYEVTAIGLWPPEHQPDSAPVQTRVLPLSKKKCIIPGDPMVNVDVLPQSVRENMHSPKQWSQTARERSSSPLAAIAQQLADRDDPDHLRQVYAEIANDYRQAAEIKASAREEGMAEVQKLAADAVAAAHSQAAEARRESQRHLELLLAQQQKSAEDRVSMLKELASGSNAAESKSTGLIMQLLPTLTDKAREEVAQVTRFYEAREERILAEHKGEITRLQHTYETQLQHAKSTYDSQIQLAQVAFENTKGLLQQQLQIAQAEKDHAIRQVEEARRQVDAIRQEMFAKALEKQQSKSTLEQLTEIAQLKEIMGNVFGNNAATPEEVGDGIENPFARSGMKLLDRLLTVAPNIMDSYAAAKVGQAQAMAQTPAQAAPPPQQLPPQPAPPQARPPQRPPQRQRPPTQAQPPTQQPAQLPAPAPTKPKITKEQLREATLFLDGVLTNNPDAPPAAADVARAAMGVVDHAVLRQLAQGKPEAVVDQLERLEVLEGATRTEKGKAYIVELLKALKELPL